MYRLRLVSLPPSHRLCWWLNLFIVFFRLALLFFGGVGWLVQGGFAFKHADNNLVVSAPEGVRLSDIDADRVKSENDALVAKKATAVRLCFFCVLVCSLCLLLRCLQPLSAAL